MKQNYCVGAGQLLQSILTSMGKTQKWLADELGTSKAAVNRMIHNDRTISIKTALKIEKLTGYDARYLLAQQTNYQLTKLKEKNNEQ